ncbi:hypothetical protein DBB_12080 [Desulfoluna spongiiphila]|nr:hypothetical protein DBB_12080 [Desulfoluna spongiiphila]
MSETTYTQKGIRLLNICVEEFQGVSVTRAPARLSSRACCTGMREGCPALPASRQTPVMPAEAGTQP